MPIDYPAVLDLKETGRRFSWTDRDTILYALAIGMGANPLDRDELPFVYEKNLKAVPTLAAVIAWGAGIAPDRIGLDRPRTLHGEEAVILHRSLPSAGEVIADSRVVAVYDKGDKGAVIERETVLNDAGSGERIATITRTAFARADGGFGGPVQTPMPHEPPRRSPDVVLEFATRRDQALLYRLCGDRNPLHADPDIARAAGFATPILHGLCTYGICCRAVLQAFCGFDSERLKSHAVRFSAPVIPGDVLTVKLWNDAGVVSFEAEVPARGVTVIKNGKSRVD
jgi:acyl dehydratase